MTYDPDIFRAILRQFAIVDSKGSTSGADKVVLAPMGGVSGNESVPEHVKRLVTLGLLQLTNDIHMKNHPDPVTLRVTEAGRPWVTRAYDDEAWGDSVRELVALTDESKE